MIDCCTLKSHDFSDIAVYGLWRCLRNSINPQSSLSTDLNWNRLVKGTFFFFFKLWQQLKWRPEIDLTGFVFKNVKVLRQIYLEMCSSRTIAFYRIYHCLRCRSSLFGFCMGARVCVFLRLWFVFFSRSWEEEHAREGCWTRLNAKREKKKHKKSQKAYVVIGSFEAECSYTVCVSILCCPLKNKPAWKITRNS